MHSAVKKQFFLFIPLLTGSKTPTSTQDAEESKKLGEG